MARLTAQAKTMVRCHHLLQPRQRKVTARLHAVTDARINVLPADSASSMPHMVICKAIVPLADAPLLLTF
jgi:hypothetical protein